MWTFQMLKDALHSFFEWLLYMSIVKSCLDMMTRVYDTSLQSTVCQRSVNTKNISTIAQNQGSEILGRPNTH